MPHFCEDFNERFGTLGELLDREFQLRILKILAQQYPQQTSVAEAFRDEGSGLDVNLAYLEDHDLIEVRWSNEISRGRIPVIANINARGLDFLADDGGLSAILGVVTVKLHDDTIRELLIGKIANAEGDQAIKDSLINKVKKLPADALGRITMWGLDFGLSKTPDLLHHLLKLLDL